MNSIDRVISEFFPDRDVPGWQRRLIEWVFGENKISPLLQAASGQQGVEWVEAIVDALQLRCEVHCSDYDNIPSQGPAIIISNHPTVVDGLALMNTVARVRKDVKIIANHVLTSIFPQIEGISIGIRNMHGKMSHRQFKEMNDHLKNGGVLIICPAGRLASVTLTGLRESRWNPGFIQLAARNNAALVPVHISGSNSLWYYFAATIWRPLSNLMIFREIARHQSNTLRMKICQQINLSSLNRQNSNNDQIAADSRKHLLLLGNGKPGFIPTQPPLAKPEKRRLLVKALNQCKILKTLNDGKILFLYRPQDDSYSPILQELGRLREISFRAIGAGTGKKRDNDCYDHEYHHVILWEPYDLEIVGAYRITPAGEQIDKKGIEGLYSYNLFKYREDCLKTIKTSFEIGRGFIQEQYQKTNALDTLWKGIFCFMGKYPEYKNLLGVLTIPRSFSAYAQGLIISFYQLYFSGLPQLRTSSEPYRLGCDKIIDFYDGSDFEQDWKKLNKTLRELGYELPWPYKQMARWFNPGGSTLVDFIEDRGFNSIAGLSICEIASLKKAYFSHYISKSAGIGSVS